MNAAREGFVKLFFLEDHASASSAQRVGRADDEGKTDFLRNLFSLEKRIGNARWGNSHTDVFHELAECFAVLGGFDGGYVDAYNFDSVFFPDAQLVCFLAKVEGGLSAHGGKHGINFLFEVSGSAFFENLHERVGVERQ